MENTLLTGMLTIFLTGILTLMNIVLLVFIKSERSRSNEREMKLIKAILAQNVFELQQAEESPKDVQKRLKIENDLAVKAEKLEKEYNKQRLENFDRVPIT